MEEIKEIVEDLDGNGIGGPGDGNGNGPLVCIKCGCCGNCECDCNGDDDCCCCCCCNGEETDGGIGGPDPEPPENCLLSGENGLENEDIIELYFTAKTKGCARDFYLGSSSINFENNNGPDQDYTCDIEGFHGPDDGDPATVNQAAFYAKRNDQIPGLYETTTWEYNTDVVELINDLILDPVENFEGAQLIDFEGLCLEYPEFPTIDEEGNE